MSWNLTLGSRAGRQCWSMSPVKWEVGLYLKSGPWGNPLVCRVRTGHFLCQGPGFDLWSGNKILQAIGCSSPPTPAKKKKNTNQWALEGLLCEGRGTDRRGWGAKLKCLRTGGVLQKQSIKLTEGRSGPHKAHLKHHLLRAAFPACASTGRPSSGLAGLISAQRRGPNP